MSDSDDQPLIIKGKMIRQDENGFVCLDDLWELSKTQASKQPRYWRRSKHLPELERHLLEIVRKSHNYSKTTIKSVVYARRGRHGATFAHPVMAAVYAGYLSPELEIEVREVWLRYRAADPTLADEILEKASDEANKWVAARAHGRIQRRRYTDVLNRAGVTGVGYGRCTNALYNGLFLRSAKQLKTAKGLPEKAQLRDHMDVFELSQITVCEGMAAGRIEDEGCRGTAECADASKVSASFIRKAIEDERASRQKRRLL